jgi:arsenate reductase
MPVTIYHNPRCSKSRQTLQLIQKRGLEPEIVEYLECPPSVGELDGILEMLKLEPRELMRTAEPEYKNAGLDDMSLSRRELLKRMAANPRVIERPIVVVDGRAVIGRPPENVLKLLK